MNSADRDAYLADLNRRILGNQVAQVVVDGVETEQAPAPNAPAPAPVTNPVDEVVANMPTLADDSYAEPAAPVPLADAPPLPQGQ